MRLAPNFFQSRLVILSYDPDEMSIWLTDGDVIRLPIEIGQVLTTVWHNVKPNQFGKLIEFSNDHVWVNWAQQNQDNYVDLWNYALDICDEYEFRFSARMPGIFRHNMIDILERLGAIPPLPDGDRTDYPIAPDQARSVYKGSGVFDKYTNRNKPEWYKS